MKELFNDRKNSLLLSAFSLIYGIGFTFLFLYGMHYGLGLNYSIYLIMICAGTYWALSFKEDFKAQNFLFISAFEIILSFTYFLSLNIFFRSIDFLIIPILYFISILSSIEIEGKIRNFFGLAFRPLANMGKFPQKTLENLTKEGENSNKKLGNAVIGIIGGIIALSVIIPIMISADEAFSAIVSPLFEFQNLGINIFRILVTIFVMCYSFAFIYCIYFKKEVKLITKSSSDENSYNDYLKQNQKTLDIDKYAVTSLTFLIVVLAAFLFFSGVQIIYLFLKVSAGLPKTFDYASYARSGIFQLWALTVINLAITLIISKKTNEIKSINQNVFKIIYTLYTATNISMTFAGFYRMKMYMDMYGFTTKRTLIMIYLAVQIILLLLLFIKIYKPDFKYEKVSFIIILVLFTITNYINIDARVAELNFQRYEVTGEIDTSYIKYGLSDDAIPYIHEYLTENSEKIPYTIYDEIAVYINNRIKWMNEADDNLNFREYNILLRKISNLPEL